MAAGQIGNWRIFGSYSWVRTQAVLVVVEKKKKPGQKETPAQRKLWVVLHFRLIIWIHRDKRMQMKNEALLVAEHTGIIQHQELFFHLFFACPRYSCSLWTVLGRPTPRCRGRDRPLAEQQHITAHWLTAQQLYDHNLVSCAVGQPTTISTSNLLSLLLLLIVLN